MPPNRSPRPLLGNQERGDDRAMCNLYSITKSQQAIRDLVMTSLQTSLLEG